MTSNFITIEGIDGSGKSSVASAVVTEIQNHGIPAILTREVGGPLVCERLRNILLSNVYEIDIKTELLLIFAARAQHLTEFIIPNLNGGNWVVCERFTDSTYAYQGGGGGVNHAHIEQLEDYVQVGFKPDLTILLDVDYALAGGRIIRENRDRFEKREKNYFKRVQRTYRNIAQRDPERVKVVDSNQEIHNVIADSRRVVEEFINTYN